jgi:aldehyde:ferredoxin oxidoreductase
MTSLEISREPVPLNLQRLGGRALIGEILNQEVKASCHPLGKHNKLIFAPGLLGGTNIPCSGRISIGAKSPLTRGFKEANSGGTLGHKLGKLGIKAIIIEGRSVKGHHYVVKLTKDGATLDETHDLGLVGNFDVTKRLLDKYGDKIATASIGPAGEMLLCASTIAISDQERRPSRHAARGGLGAVMGSKGIKALVVDDTGCGVVKPKNPQAYRSIVKKFVDYLKSDPQIQSRSKYGTAEGIWHAIDAGWLPTRNFSSGYFEESENIDADAIGKVVKERSGYMTACMPGCIIECTHVLKDRDKNYLTSSLEYETLAMLGSNLGIGNLDTICLLNRMCNDIGIDTIEIGGTLGILTETEFFQFGDCEKALDLLNEIKNGTILGRVLGQGVEVTGRVFGIDRIPAIKGQGMPAYDPRALKTMGITLATSALGADHTAGWMVRGEKYEDQVIHSMERQIAFALMDTLGMCLFTRIMLFDNLNYMTGFLNGLYGWDFVEADLLKFGKEILKKEKRFNKKAGLDFYTNQVPDFFRDEACSPTGNVFDVPEELLWLSELE